MAECRRIVTAEVVASAQKTSCVTDLGRYGQIGNFCADDSFHQKCCHWQAFAAWPSSSAEAAEQACQRTLGSMLSSCALQGRVTVQNTKCYVYMNGAAQGCIGPRCM